MCVPAGFVPHDRKSAVTNAWEPLFARATESALQLGLRIGAEHCNSRGFLHGGVIAALADNAMGLTLGRHTGRSAVTVGLAVDYVGAAKLGQWMQIEPRFVRAGGSIGFVDALITADGETIARANATFRIVA
jgi:uncharacterized protein (TIGR00369 family)